MKKVLINMSNIHCGGAIQVATSFFSEVVYNGVPIEADVHFLLSDEVYESVSNLCFDNIDFEYKIFNTYGFRTLISSLNFIQLKYDVIFTLFGPKYTFLNGNFNIVGFAQSWIINTDNHAAKLLKIHKKLLFRVKYFFQKKFFQRADHLVVELKHVKVGIVNKGLFSSNDISIVHNCISNLYYNKNEWVDIQFERSLEHIKIGYICRDYVHKNIKILPSVARILNEYYKLSVKFYLTLNDSEWSKYEKDFNGYAINLGVISPYQCPDFYKKMDSVIFPSLLESFSATPFEALFMKKPLFASDLSFVHDVCLHNAIYINPLDEYDIAKKIFDFFKHEELPYYNLDLAKDYVKNFSDAKKRYLDYFDIINNFL